METIPMKMNGELEKVESWLARKLADNDDLRSLLRVAGSNPDREQQLVNNSTAICKCRKWLASVRAEFQSTNF